MTDFDGHTRKTRCPTATASRTALTPGRRRPTRCWRRGPMTAPLSRPPSSAVSARARALVCVCVLVMLQCTCVEATCQAPPLYARGRCAIRPPVPLQPNHGSMIQCSPRSCTSGSNETGKWRPTPPMFMPGLTPQVCACARCDLVPAGCVLGASPPSDNWTPSPHCLTQHNRPHVASSPP